MLADLESLEKRLIAAQKKARGGDKESIAAVGLMEPLVAALAATAGRRAASCLAGQAEAVKRLQLLTTKPVLYVCNVEEAAAATGNAFSAAWSRRAPVRKARVSVFVSAAIEAEVSQLPEADRGEFLEGLGLHDSGLDRVIRAGYDLLESGHLLHRRAEGGTRLDHRARHEGAAGRRHDPWRFRTRLHRLRDDCLRRLCRAARAKPARRKRARCASKARNTSCKDGDVLLFRFNV